MRVGVPDIFFLLCAPVRGGFGLRPDGRTGEPAVVILLADNDMVVALGDGRLARLRLARHLDVHALTSVRARSDAGNDGPIIVR